MCMCHVLAPDILKQKGDLLGRIGLIHLQLSTVYVEIRAFSIRAMGTTHLKLSLVQLLLGLCAWL